MTVLKIIGIILLVILVLLIIALNIPVKVRAAYKNKKFGAEIKYLFFRVYRLGTLPEDRPGESGEDDGGAEDTDTGDTDPGDTDPGGDGKTDGEAADDAADAPSADEEETNGSADAAYTGTSDTSSEGEKPDENADEQPDEHQTAAAEDKPVKKKKRHGKPFGDRIADLIDNIQRKTEAGLAAVELVWDPLISMIKKIYFTGVEADLAAASEDAAEAAITYGALNAAVYGTLGQLCRLTRVNIRSVRIDCLYDTPKEDARYDAELTLRMRPASLVNALLRIGARFLFGLKKYKIIIDEFIK